MFSKFRETSKAINYLAGGLQGDFPGGKVEVMLFSKGRCRKTKTDVEHVSQVLEMFCRKFPKASVTYTPDNPYGMVGEIQCHGETNPGQSTVFQRRRDDSTRPRVVVIVTGIGSDDVMVGRQHLPQTGASILDRPEEPPRRQGE